MNQNSEIEELKDIGFIEIGSWELNNDGYGIHIEKANDYHSLTKNRGIYSFVVEKNDTSISYKIKYFGTSEVHDGNIHYRLSKYHTSNKSPKCKKEKIIERLKAGDKVKIFVFAPSDELQNNFQYKTLNVDLVRGLEYSLIDKFKTSKKINGWNKRY
ncbi:hypothetical protein MCP_2215 [Methanocella paludicola SANAE]|uniref:GIY-YIG domain-containing protein n=1 Tax=Methanocella paludicola (strain DSM 17711 / JCM 13418 / NBRC 101707 / SANAE) TaxID=304371 RepID=D1Z0R5_METPS|nr:hypothetical protein [Methanocella paludicola]BAI62287.1 hypothetical protein MCP_2215 [Methanocella paludicola SANAE]